ncbi:unnamed protein product [Calypogeia fissa]
MHEPSVFATRSSTSLDSILSFPPRPTFRIGLLTGKAIITLIRIVTKYPQALSFADSPLSQRKRRMVLLHWFGLSQIIMPRVFTHSGPYQEISSDSSPGLRFLKELLPALDSLEPTTNPISKYLTVSAHFITNGGNPVSADTVAAMLKMRSEKVSDFHHSVKKCWDLEREDGKRTVMYELISTTILKCDPEGKAAEIPEFNVVELEEMEGGVEGLGAYELRVYMDAQPVMQRFKELAQGAV